MSTFIRHTEFIRDLRLLRPPFYSSHTCTLADGRTLRMARTILALPACTATVVMVVVGASCSPTSEKSTSIATSLTPASRCSTPPLTTAGPSTTGPSTVVLALRLIAYRFAPVPRRIRLLPTARDDALAAALWCFRFRRDLASMASRRLSYTQSDNDQVVSESRYEKAPPQRTLSAELLFFNAPVSYTHLTLPTILRV